MHILDYIERCQSFCGFNHTGWPQLMLRKIKFELKPYGFVKIFKIIIAI